MRIFLVFLFCVATGLPSLAQGSDRKLFLVENRRLDHVENPDHLNLWRKALDSKEARFVGDAITSAYGCVGCYSMVGQAINTLVPFPAGGEEHKGAFQAPRGYTVCRAYARDVSLNCNGTLTGSYRTADDPHSANVDGLHWYIVVPKPAGVAPGRCWVDAKITVEFLRALPGYRQRYKCAPSGSIAFHYGK